MLHTAHGFPPIETPDAQILILGSMPGIKSLEDQQYYAHPRNSFWPIICQLLNEKPLEIYSDKINLVKQRHIALWDVLKYCERKGSLDMNIKGSTIAANDFESFFNDHPNIKHVYFNGVKSAQEFTKRVLPELSPKHAEIQYHRLPSTSPAMASLTREQKLEKWSIIQTALAL